MLIIPFYKPFHRNLSLQLEPFTDCSLISVAFFRNRCKSGLKLFCIRGLDTDTGLKANSDLINPFSRFKPFAELIEIAPRILKKVASGATSRLSLRRGGRLMESTISRQIRVLAVIITLVTVIDNVEVVAIISGDLISDCYRTLRLNLYQSGKSIFLEMPRYN